jgi:hypothetical protein
MSENVSNPHVKILLEFENEEGSIEFESLWALPEGDGFKLDNIPFYVQGYAWGDVVAATPDEDGLLRVRGLIQPSGHSTVRLWFRDPGDVPAVRQTLRAMNCGSELDRSRLVAVDVPATVDYGMVREYLDEKESVGVFEYEEACLGHSG